MTKQRKNSSFFHSAQMMVATECWLVHTKTVVKRMAGSITPSAKNTVARMIRKLKAKLRKVDGGWAGLAEIDGGAGPGAAVAVSELLASVRSQAYARIMNSTAAVKK